jgi:hypothetical protein
MWEQNEARYPILETSRNFWTQNITIHTPTKYHGWLYQMTTKLEGHVALMTELGSAHKILLRKPAERDDLADLVNVRIILKLVVHTIIWTGFM